MKESVQIITCDRCRDIINKDITFHSYVMHEHEFDFCEDCNKRFMMFWNEFWRPNIAERSFKVNSKFLLKKKTGEEW